MDADTDINKVFFSGTKSNLPSNIVNIFHVIYTSNTEVPQIPLGSGACYYAGVRHYF